MNEPDNQASSAIRGYLSAWRRQWWIVAGATLVAVLIAAAWSSTQKPVFAAEMKIVVGQGQALGGSPLPIDAQSLTQTMTDLLESDVVADKAAKQVDFEVTPTELLSHLSVTTKPEASVLNVTYEDTNRNHAREALNRVGEVFTQLVDSRLGSGAPAGEPGAPEQVVTAKVFDPAHDVPDQVSPKTKRNMVIAGILGLLAGLFLALFRDSLSLRVRSLGEAEQAFGAQVVGLLPPGAIGKRHPGIAGGARPSGEQRFDNAFEILAANIRFTIAHPDSGAILVTSAMPQEGKTQMVANIARTMARTGLSVVAVEADVRRPALHSLFQVPPQQPGLTDVVRGEIALNDALIPVSDPEADLPIQLLTAGSHLGEAHDIFTVRRSSQLIESLREVTDYVVIDSAPLLLVPDAYPLAQLVDRVLVVAREGSTKRDEADRVREKLISLGVGNFSVVLTESSEAVNRTYEYRSTPKI